MLLTAFYALLRASEFLETNSKHNLHYRQVKIVRKGNQKVIRITFHTYKHSKGDCQLEIQPTNDDWCPVNHLSSYLEARGSKPGPFFVNPDGLAVSRNKFAKFLKECIAFSGRNPKRYNVHSLRVGKATQMLADQCADSTIRAAGRWNTPAFKGYLRPKSLTLPR